MTPPRRWRLSALIALVTTALIVTTLALAFWVFNTQLMASLERANGARVVNLAQAVALRKDVGLALKGPAPVPVATGRPPSELQRTIDRLRATLDVDFIVVMTPASLRLTHPNRARIGHHFIGGDEVRALTRGESYVSYAKGTLGISLRGFSPVMDAQGNVIGAVSVGVTMSKLSPLLDRNRWELLATLGAIGALGVVIAVWFSRTVKRQLLNMEPRDIAHLVQEREAMLDAMQDGVLAMDSTGRVRRINPAGRRLLERLERAPLAAGDLLASRFPELSMLADNHLEGAHQTVQLDDMTLLATFSPILWKQERQGGLITFRDKNDVHVLAEELTGVRRYAEALRASTHEFKNKIHVIQGLVHLKDLPALERYVKEIMEHRVTPSNALGGQVQEPALAGFLLGKQSEARERAITLDLQVSARIDAQSHSRTVHDLVSILGNVLDNAFEALAETEAPQVCLLMDREGESLSIQVQDNGPGIDPAIADRLFERGVSGKGAHRGLGLSLVKERLDTAGGDIAVYSTPGEGTLIEMMYPYWSDDDVDEQ
ncbi:ATP-binding protein [Larsenimonas suaedae]|uniref:histidine kinase n=1 Tax=Larsenimonas suaedae TaxID=1851019 RepID=A0ABU1GU25_9GAMM|nr:ATP-binding protein [Larsenimonas suaedae]MCM2971970.1 ATP-binding protein [Larsenimonas suaedae]MDR5895522.1 ATP-binding protein [Larsenimonas suaedae]